MIDFANEKFDLMSEGSIFWVNKKILILADLHLEKGSFFHSKGQFISPYDTIETIKKLEKCIEKSNPSKIIFLGDTFHDKYSIKRMENSNIKKLKKIFNNFDCSLIKGNHDENLISDFFIFEDEIIINGITFAHKTEFFEKFEVSGHFHPIAFFYYKGIKVKNKCFVFTKNKIILPSFGTFTGGMNVKDINFKIKNKKEIKIFMIMNEKIINENFENIK